MEAEENESAEQSVCQVCKKKFRNPEKLSLHMGFHSLFGNFKKSVGHAENNKSEEVNTKNGKWPARCVLLRNHFSPDGIFFIST